MSSPGQKDMELVLQEATAEVAFDRAVNSYFHLNKVYDSLPLKEARQLPR
jgi:hypothetical protein